MARLRHLETGQLRAVPARARLGRDPTCELPVDGGVASRLHALLHWGGGEWRLRDLGSRNGTWCGGRRLAPGEEAPLGAGDRIHLGAGDVTLEVVDVDPPRPMALPVAGGAGVEALGEVLLLPGEPPCILHATPGGWAVVGRDGDEPLVDGGIVVDGGGRPWRLVLPESVGATGRGGDPGSGWVLQVDGGADAARVAARVGTPTGEVDLRTRAHHRILWVLARERSREERRGVPPAEAGWVQPEDLRRFMDLMSSTFYVHLFRLRQQLEEAGLGADGPVLERRGTGEIRVGTATVRVEGGPPPGGRPASPR